MPQGKAVRRYRKSDQRRFQWTQELHGHFVEAVARLGGEKSATPKQILQEMRVDGLQISQIKSHLQNYRSRRKRLKSAMDTVTPLKGPRFQCERTTASWEHEEVRDKEATVVEANSVIASPAIGHMSSGNYIDKVQTSKRPSMFSSATQGESGSNATNEDHHLKTLKCGSRNFVQDNPGKNLPFHLANLSWSGLNLDMEEIWEGFELSVSKPYPSSLMEKEDSDEDMIGTLLSTPMPRSNDDVCHSIHVDIQTTYVDKDSRQVAAPKSCDVHPSSTFCGDQVIAAGCQSLASSLWKKIYENLVNASPNIVHSIKGEVMKILAFFQSFPSEDLSRKNTIIMEFLDHSSRLINLEASAFEYEKKISAAEAYLSQQKKGNEEGANDLQTIINERKSMLHKRTRLEEKLAKLSEEIDKASRQIDEASKALESRNIHIEAIEAQLEANRHEVFLTDLEGKSLSELRSIMEEKRATLKSLLN